MVERLANTLDQKHTAPTKVPFTERVQKAYDGTEISFARETVIATVAALLTLTWRKWQGKTEISDDLVPIAIAAIAAAFVGGRGRWFRPPGTGPSGDLGVGEKSCRPGNFFVPIPGAWSGRFIRFRDASRFGWIRLAQRARSLAHHDEWKRRDFARRTFVSLRVELQVALECV